MTTVSCPRCHQLVESQAITCPHCRTTLKAFGHPGIPLHRATGDEYLCNSCTYHADDTCNFPQRPYAKECTLYQNIAEYKLQQEQQHHNSSVATTFQSCIKRNQTWLLLLVLLLICLVIALATS
ncbi:zinc ribbon domain-containing protein [Nostoc sp. LEGE 06077]|uniref:zinc ribbon domain-containing protein n=1 Tax=Nostoc sp. LEGE 06077 TaxID=915325 RepID=UPI001882CCDD|nr:zinc ribbon domain-containing protein [Nostoc sp. LEGE 06077]MBE9205020.1 zinc ribbon domain-containing protein [Nostoc sp. LEGE 06077]